jgi:PAS domain S-box-containing protein
MPGFPALSSPLWRFVAAPLAVWVVLLAAAAGALTWVNTSARVELEHRFKLRVQIASDFVATYISDLVGRERAQALRYLAGAEVDADAFEQSVLAFGYPAAVLLGGDGRALHVVPPTANLVGADLAARYAHLGAALRENRPAVSAVVPSAAAGLPVVALAVPYDTPTGRRVFSGAIEVRSSPLGAYLPHAIALHAAEVYLVDSAGVIVGSNRTVSGLEKLVNRKPQLAGPATQRPRGSYRSGGDQFHYDSEPVPGTPWRLIAAVPSDVLYEPIFGTAVWTSASLAMLTLFGFGAVLLSARGARNRAELRESEERFRGLFDNSLVGMSLSSPVDGRLVRVNAALCDMLGYGVDELLGRAWRDITHPDDIEPDATLQREAVAGRRRGYSLEKRFLHADGHTVPGSLTTALLRDDRNRPMHFSTQVVDISERHRLAEEEQRARDELTARAVELQRANHALQDAQQRTADLVAMLSHDVRQPLGVISGYCDLLLESWEHTDERQKRRDLSRIAQAGTGMMQLVEEVLTLTELDNADLQPRRAPIVVVRAVEQAIAGLFLDQRDGVEVAVEPDVLVFADARHLQQVLINLLSNARKYGGDGEVRVDAVRLGDTVRIRVADTGEGVPAEFEPHLFERFSRAERGVAPTRQGTGLGLYIARQLVEANGGAIRHERNEPHGSRFVVSLPTAVAVQPTPQVAVAGR